VKVGQKLVLIVDKVLIVRILMHVLQEIRSVETAARLDILLECASMASVSVAQLVNATVHATGTGGQTTLRFSSGDVWFAY